MVFGSVQALAGGVLRSVASGAEEVANRIARRGSVIIVAILGTWFLLNGFAKLLDFLYATPGIGEVFVGAIALLAAIVLSVVWKK